MIDIFFNFFLEFLVITLVIKLKLNNRLFNISFQLIVRTKSGHVRWWGSSFLDVDEQYSLIDCNTIPIPYKNLNINTGTNTVLVLNATIKNFDQPKLLRSFSQTFIMCYSSLMYAHIQSLGPHQHKQLFSSSPLFVYATIHLKSP